MENVPIIGGEPRNYCELEPSVRPSRAMDFITANDGGTTTGRGIDVYSWVALTRLRSPSTGPNRSDKHQGGRASRHRDESHTYMDNSDGDGSRPGCRGDCHM